MLKALDDFKYEVSGKKQQKKLISENDLLKILSGRGGKSDE